MIGKTLISGTVLERFRTQGLRIGVLHAGGPAPGGNQVLYAAALRARDQGVPLVAFRNGYSHLVGGDAAAAEREGSFLIGPEQVRSLRDQASLLIGTSRVNPGKPIKTVDDLNDSAKTTELTRVLDVFETLRIGGLISIGGDDTMRTANLLQRKLDGLALAGRRYDNFAGAVHVPKTIDKDYPGIDFTFGFMTAAEFYGQMVMGFHDDAKAAGTADQPVYHVVEVMGRAAGWLAAMSSILGQSTYTIVPEDYLDEHGNSRPVTLDALAKDCVDVILTRREQGKYYGVITFAEGIGDILPALAAELDDHGHTRLDQLELGTRLKDAIAVELKKRNGPKTKLHAQKAGYVARQAEPSAFDVILCQRLGVSAVDALLTGQYGNMVSVGGVFDPKLISFSSLVDPITLKVKNWRMSTAGGLYGLLRAMEQPFDHNVGVKT